jgi:outer membrane lipoprotein-sorting protein
MKCFTLFAAVLAACQADGSKDPKALVEQAASRTRGQKSYQTRFTAVLTPPQGDTLKYDGQAVWAAPGVLTIHYTATGGDDKNIVRVGEKVWVYHSLVGWVTADEAGMPGAGRGVQNPDEVLGVLAKQAGIAKLREPGVAELSFSGDDIEKIMKEQAQQGAFVWKESSAAVVLTADGDGRLKKFTCKASLKPSDPKIAGTVTYEADVEVVSYNAVEELAFKDEKGKAIPLTKPMLQAVEALKKERK